MPDLCYLCLAAPSEVRAPGYGFDVCTPCWRRAQQGWAAEFEPAIFSALARAGLLIPDRNELDRLPREYSPPANFDL